MPRRKREIDPPQQWLASLHPALRMLAQWPGWEDVSGGTLVVACSGGRDSVALAHAAWNLLCNQVEEVFTSYIVQRPLHNSHRLKLDGSCKLPELVLWHYDHGLRHGSELDAQFVLAFGEHLGARTVTTEGKLREHPEFGRWNIAALARGCRYAALELFLQSESIKHAGHWPVQAVLAHHQQDQAETVLHNLLRGTSLRGLRGMDPESAMRCRSIKRPWLRLDPQLVEDYCRANGLRWQTDPSNASASSSRSLIRNQILPLLQGLNKRAVRHIAETSFDLQGLSRVMHGALPPPKIYGSLLRLRLPLFGKPSPHGYIWLKLPELESGSLAQWLALEESIGEWTAYDRTEVSKLRRWLAKPQGSLQFGGAILSSGENILAIKPSPHTADRLFATRAGDTRPPHGYIHHEPAPPLAELAVPLSAEHPWADRLHYEEVKPGALTRDSLTESYRIDNWWLHIAREIEAYDVAMTGQTAWPTPTYKCLLPPGIRGPLKLRIPVTGDRIELPSSTPQAPRHKKLSDIFIDAKVPRAFRAHWMALVDAQERILWVPGLADTKTMHSTRDCGAAIRIELTPFAPTAQRLAAARQLIHEIEGEELQP